LRDRSLAEAGPESFSNSGEVEALKAQLASAEAEVAAMRARLDALEKKE